MKQVTPHPPKANLTLGGSAQLQTSKIPESLVDGKRRIGGKFSKSVTQHWINKASASGIRK